MQQPDNAATNDLSMRSEKMAIILCLCAAVLLAITVAFARVFHGNDGRNAAVAALSMRERDAQLLRENFADELFMSSPPPPEGVAMTKKME